MADLLIAGGGGDPNLKWLLATAERLGVSCQSVLSTTDPPRFSWEIGGKAMVDGVPIDCRAAFVRFDVFASNGGSDGPEVAIAHAWFAALASLCVAERMFTLNRRIDQMSGSKPAMLLEAQAFGLAIPRTLLTNSRELATGFAGGAAIAKPAAGGSYVTTLEHAMSEASWSDDLSPSPALVQPRLTYPERRIYRVGEQFFVYDIGSTTLDSRLDRKMQITALPLDAVPADVIDKLRKLTDHIACDFCAVDMKTDPETGGLVFLELNNGPMFAAYDRAGGGTMGEAIVRYLVEGAA